MATQTLPPAPRRAGARPGLVAALAALLLVATAPTARAGTGIDTQRFAPALHSFGQFRAESAKVSTGITPNFILVFNHASKLNGPVFDPSADPTIDQTPGLDSLGTLNLLASLSFADFFSVGFDLPLHLYRSGTTQTTASPELPGFTLGDLRLSLKGAVLPPRKYKVGVALGLDIGIPTGGGDGFTDEESAWIAPRLFFESRGKGIRVLYNAAFMTRFADLDSIFGPGAPAVRHVSNERRGGDARYLTEMRHVAGIGILPDDETDAFEIILEAAASTSLNSPFKKDTLYVEAGGGLKYTHPQGFMVGAGVSAGFADGYGDPDFRFFSSIGYQKETYRPEDTDGDGILDEDDKCPEDPEDADGWEDDDGCPDLDNDNDGIFDLVDQCPNQAEDKDGVADEDGCPDFDTDGDGIDDPLDQCPSEPEDADGFQDIDGCPDVDNDGDGIPDSADRCPNDAEDKDEIQDLDGCPETDADGDAIPDEDDKCPLEPENINGCEDLDGCPEAKKVCVTDTAIRITEKIFFATNRARILKQSYELLEEIGEVILNHPEIEKIEIQGHTDSRGNARYNRRLSEKRAKAVYQALKKMGVPRARMTFKGYGEEMPIADNETDDGRATNRRVEFIILERSNP